MKDTGVNESILKNIERKSERTDTVDFIETGGSKTPLFSWLDINPTELCNRKCVFCPRSQGFKNSNLHMDLNLAKKMARELKALIFTGTINISGNGEPLLHKDIVGLVNCFNNFQVEIVTNGDKLNVELIKDLYANGLKYLVVSMYDGPEQIEKFKNLFKLAGCTEDQFALRDRWYKEEDGYGLILTNRAGYLKSKIKIEPFKHCFYVHYSIQVDWNGDILLCSHTIYDKSFTFGNLNEQSLSELWTSDALNKYRKNLGNGDRKCLNPCSSCDAMGTALGKNHRLAWEKHFSEKEKAK